KTSRLFFSASMSVSPSGPIPRRSVASAVVWIALSMSVTPLRSPQPEEVPFVDVDRLAVRHHQRGRGVLDDRRSGDAVAGLQEIHLPERSRLPPPLPVHVARPLARLLLGLGRTERLLDDARLHLLDGGQETELEDLIARALVARDPRV